MSYTILHSYSYQESARFQVWLVLTWSDGITRRVLIYSRQ